MNCFGFKQEQLDDLDMRREELAMQLATLQRMYRREVRLREVLKVRGWAPEPGFGRMARRLMGLGGVLGFTERTARRSGA